MSAHIKSVNRKAQIDSFYDRKLNALILNQLMSPNWSLAFCCYFWPLWETRICIKNLDINQKKFASWIYCHKKLRIAHHCNTLLRWKEQWEKGGTIQLIQDGTERDAVKS